MTSYPSIKTDLKNAGADWRDKEVVVDDNLITSRSPKDLDAFNKKLLEANKGRRTRTCVGLVYIDSDIKGWYKACLISVGFLIYTLSFIHISPSGHTISFYQHR